MNPQQTAIATLERKGFRFVCWFDAHDGNGGQCATMQKTHSRIQHVQCEVDPDGTCNGMTVDAYLATLRPTVSQPDTCPRGYMGMRD